jgi:hypothetical protein
LGRVALSMLMVIIVCQSLFVQTVESLFDE